MKIAAAADLLGHLPEVPPCDLLLLAGDVLLPSSSAGVQRDWILTRLRPWLEAVPARHVVAVAGSHDVLLDDHPGFVPAGLRWTYLRDSGVEVEGVRIWGTPWVRHYPGCRAFFAPQDPAVGPGFLTERFGRIPDSVDVLVCHGPPWGYGDELADGRHTGSVELLDAINRVLPRLAVFGQHHGRRGRWRIEAEGFVSEIANVTVRDAEGRVAQDPKVLDVEPNRLTSLPQSPPAVEPAPVPRQRTVTLEVGQRVWWWRRRRRRRANASPPEGPGKVLCSGVVTRADWHVADVLEDGEPRPRMHVVANLLTVTPAAGAGGPTPMPPPTGC